MVDENIQQIENDDLSLLEDNPEVDNDALLLNQDFKEAEDVPEENPDTGTEVKTEKKKTNLSFMSMGTVAVISSALIGITSLINVAMTASFTEVKNEDSKIQYSVETENFTDEESLSIYLLEDGKQIQIIELKDEDKDGIIQGEIPLDGASVAEKVSKSGTGKLSYRLTLKGVVGLEVEREFDSYLVEIQNVNSKFNKVEGECFCSRDGTYHFTMDFEDDMGIFTDFKAEIKDTFGNASQCIFTDNLHELQKINVCDLKGSTATLIITFMAKGELQTVTLDITI